MLLSGVVDDLSEAIVVSFGIRRIINGVVCALISIIVYVLILRIDFAVKPMHIFWPRWTRSSFTENLGAIVVDFIREAHPILVHI